MKAEMKHGVYSNYPRCRGENGEACAACKADMARYQREYLAARPEKREQRRACDAARSRAFQRLAGMNPTVFKALLDEEMGRAS